MVKKENSLPYNPNDKKSIFQYAINLEGKTLRNFCKLSELEEEYKGKGGFGQRLEEAYFGIRNNSESHPDFEEVGLELKSFPLKKTRNGVVAKERLVCNIIDYDRIKDEEFETSHFLEKNKSLLLIGYIYDMKNSQLDYPIEYIDIWDINEIEKLDRMIIKRDWERIVNKILLGKAHELTEGETLYLGACRKGKGGLKKDLRPQPFSKILAPQRAFCLKKKYMDSLLRQFNDQESILNHPKEIENISFEEVVYSKFKPYFGLNGNQIEAKLSTSLSQSKHYYRRLSRLIMGVKTRKIQEFEKADIIMKTIRVRRNGKPIEHISFPHFEYIKIAEQTWESSNLFEMLEKKFFFVIFKESDKAKKEFELDDVLFWNMPHRDITKAGEVWKNTKRAIIDNNYEFPKISDGFIIHVRPHSTKTDKGSLTPQGNLRQKKSFWISADYIWEQLQKSSSAKHPRQAY